MLLPYGLAIIGVVCVTFMISVSIISLVIEILLVSDCITTGTLTKW